MYRGHAYFLLLLANKMSKYDSTNTDKCTEKCTETIHTNQCNNKKILNNNKKNIK